MSYRLKCNHEKPKYGHHSAIHAFFNWGLNVNSNHCCLCIGYFIFLAMSHRKFGYIWLGLYQIVSGESSDWERHGWSLMSLDKCLLKIWWFPDSGANKYSRLMEYDWDILWWHLLNYLHCQLLLHVREYVYQFYWLRRSLNKE